PRLPSVPLACSSTATAAVKKSLSWSAFRSRSRVTTMRGTRTPWVAWLARPSRPAGDPRISLMAGERLPLGAGGCLTTPVALLPSGYEAAPAPAGARPRGAGGCADTGRGRYRRPGRREPARPADRAEPADRGHRRAGREPARQPGRHVLHPGWVRPGARGARRARVRRHQEL